MVVIQIVYQKTNGDLIERIRNTPIQHRVGEKTSMRWLIKSIKYNYKGRYYDRTDYDRLINHDWNKYKNRNNLKKKIFGIYCNVIYFLALLTMFRVYEIISKLAS